jgi:hypothetical protein
MCEDFTVWLNDASLPFEDRCRLAELLIRRRPSADTQSQQPDVERVEAQIATVIGALRLYADTLATWEGEGGR